MAAVVGWWRNIRFLVCSGELEVLHVVLQSIMTQCWRHKVYKIPDGELWARIRWAFQLTKLISIGRFFESYGYFLTSMKTNSSWCRTKAYGTNKVNRKGSSSLKKSVAIGTLTTPHEGWSFSCRQLPKRTWAVGWEVCVGGIDKTPASIAAVVTDGSPWKTERVWCHAPPSKTGSGSVLRHHSHLPSSFRGKWIPVSFMLLLPHF